MEEKIRFTAHLKNFAGLLAGLPPRLVAEIREAFNAAVSALQLEHEKLRLKGIPASEWPILDAGAFLEQLPQQFSFDGMALKRAVDKEARKRGNEWAARYMPAVFREHVPPLAPPPPPDRLAELERRVQQLEGVPTSA